ncbi:MAG: PKD domain-containing protein, partial [Bacteroidia bacterium]
MLLIVTSTAFGQSPIASFTVPNTQGCVPFNVQFTNTSSNAISYQWNFGNGNTSVIANPGNVFTLPGVYAVSLTATSANGLTSTTSTQITVNPKPIANFSVSINTGCQGTQVFDFQNQSTLFDSCVWDFGDGTTSNLLNPQHIYNIPGTFNVTLVVYSIQYGCSNLIAKNNLITIYPSPTAILTVNDTVSCDHQFQFQFGSQINNATSWTWDFGDGFTSSLQNLSHVYADTGYFQVQLNMISANGCSSSSPLNTKIHLKWNPIPNVVISDDTGCKPHLVSLVSTYYSNSLYSWDLGNGLTSTGSTIFHSYLDSGLFPVTLNVSYTNGCQQSINAGTVTVLQKP